MYFPPPGGYNKAKALNTAVANSYVVRGMGKKVVVELPGMVKIPDDEVEQRVKIELALRLYERGILSFGQARRLAGVSKWEFIELLAKEEGIVYDEEELENDLQVLEELS